MERYATVAARDLEALPEDGDRTDFFYREATRYPALSRADEDALARQLVRRRRAICRLLRGEHALVRRALAGAGKSAVDPAKEFREREAIRVLARARQEAQAATAGESAKAFADRLHSELQEYRRLRDRMVRGNLRLVIALARRYRHPTLSELDLVQEGVLGLIRAVERYDPNRGTRFSTYAVWWIWQQLARAADNLGATIRVPVHWSQFRRKLRRKIRGLGAASEAEILALAEEHGIPTAYARRMERGVLCISLDTPPADDEGFPLLSRAAASSSTDPACASESRDLRERLVAALNSLPPRDGEILRLRYGFAPGGPFTLEEIGRRYGVSRERIRQLEARAIAHMRRICRDNGLADYV